MLITHPNYSDITLSDDPRLVQPTRVKELLDQSYWAPGRSLALIERSIANSVVFGIYTQNTQIGYARVITDSCTFGYLCDVIIDPLHREKGLGTWLVEVITEHPEIRDCGKLMLKTRDAHGLYEKFGFKLAIQPESIMEKNHA